MNRTIKQRVNVSVNIALDCEVYQIGLCLARPGSELVQVLEIHGFAECILEADFKIRVLGILTFFLTNS